MRNQIRLVNNERSWAIDLISEINKIVSGYQLNIASAGGEKTINNSQTVVDGARKIMFPDVLLYGDINRTRIIQGWEIKLPDVPVTDETYIKDAQYKADILNIDSTILWNFNQVVLYTKENDKWKIKKQWNDLANIKNREDVEKYRLQWLTFLKEFIFELNNFYSNGTFTSKGLDEISDSIMVQIIERNKQALSSHLEYSAAQDRKISISINNWWSYFKNEYMDDEDNSYEAYSKNLLLNWINRFTFANFIRNTHVSAREIMNVTKEDTPEEVNRIFKSITESADFYTIFESQDYNDILPLSVWSDLIDYNSFLQDKVIIHESLQKLLEGTVSTLKRQVIGQYTTPGKLAQLLVRSTMIDATRDAIDPCCGTGTIPKAVISLKKEQGISIEEIHQTTWASDKFSFPLQIANLAMTSSDSMNLENKVFQENVFKLKENSLIEIRSPKSGEVIEHSLPKFKTIVSNLPFVPFEIISDDEKELLSSQNQKIKQSTNGELSFDGRSDLYEYITIFLNSILDDNGRIGIILSNSWLASAKGKSFYRMILHHFNLKSVISSGNKKWFKNADVMSTIIILEKKDNLGVMQNEKIQFALINKPIESLGEEEINVMGDRILEQQFCENTSGNLYNIQEIEEIQQYNLSLNVLFYDVTWIKDIKDKLVPISSVFNVIRGMRRGWDKLFYPSADNDIEAKYLKRVLKSSKSIKYFTAETDNDAFCCSASLTELEEQEDTGALEWINKFKDGVNKTGKPLVEVLAKKNMQWYEMKSEGSIAEFVTSINPEKRLFWARLEEPAFINQRLTGLNKLDEGLNSELLHALLNSLLGKFFIESAGFGRGLGALDTSKNNIENSYMLNPKLVTDAEAKTIIDAFSNIKHKEVKDTILEIEEEEYKFFDLIVLEIYGIASYYDCIKKSLEGMINTRLSVKD